MWFTPIWSFHYTAELHGEIEKKKEPQHQLSKASLPKREKLDKSDRLVQKEQRNPYQKYVGGNIYLK